MPLSAAEIIRSLSLAPHPEGGHFREMFRDEKTVEGGRAASTAIYYLLQAGERSHWHRIDCAEVWHHYAGAPLALHLSEDGKSTHTIRLGKDLTGGEHPQAVIPPQAWQAAEPLGDWCLLGCTVAPGFDFATFELAPKDWTPG